MASAITYDWTHGQMTAGSGEQDDHANRLAREDSVQHHARRLLVTAEEAAQLLGIGRTLMFALIQSGAVASVRIGRLRRVPVEALDQFVRSLRESEQSTEELVGRVTRTDGSAGSTAAETARPERRSS